MSYIDIYGNSDYIPEDSCSSTTGGGTDGVGISDISQIGSTNQVLITLTNAQQYTINVPTIPGDIGPQGEQGIPGINGTNGTNGVDGATGATGAAGSNGINGTNGTNGINGINFLNGSGVPSSGLGNNGDAYFNYLNGSVYTKSTGIWTFRITLKGTDGIDGIQIPFAERNQILYYLNDNTTDVYNDDLFKVGAFVYTDTQLTLAKTKVITFADIFNKWKRFSHGGQILDPQNPQQSNNIPCVPDLTNSWSYDSGTQTINSTLNSGSHIGFVSPKKYNKYTHSVTLTSSNTLDNDYINVVIAFVEDRTDMVANQAYGLNPADFNWPINVTDQFIPNQHSLTLLRGRNGSNSYTLIYDYQKLTQQTIFDGSSLPFATNLNWSGATVDIQIIRTDNIINCFTTDFSDAPSGKGSLRFPISTDLSAIPVLNKFRGPASYGYSTHSQGLAGWTNTSFSSTDNIIYDLRSGNIWVADSTGTYNLITSRNFYDEIGIRKLLYNPDEKTLIGVNPDETYTIINDSKIIIGVGDDTSGVFTNSSLNTAFPDATLSQQVLSATRVYEKKDDTTWFYFTKTDC